MNAQRTHADLNAAESAAGRILEPSEVTEDPMDLAAALPSLEARRALADQLWVDALLEHALGSGAARVARQLERTSHALQVCQPGAAPEPRLSREHDEPPLSREPAVLSVSHGGVASRYRRWGAGLAIVLAGLAIIAVLAVPRTSKQATASELLDAAIRSFSARLYREYAVVVEHPNLAEPKRGHLAVADRRRFFVDWPSPIGQIRAGSDGRQRWLMPPVGPVLVLAETPSTASEAATRQPTIERLGHDNAITSALGHQHSNIPLPAQSLEAARDLEYLSLAALLARIQSRYDVAYLPEGRGQPVRDANGSVRLIAIRRGEHTSWGEPEAMEILLAADPYRLAHEAEDIAVREVVLRFPDTRIPMGPKQVSFSLQSSRPATAKDDRVFSHASHHLGERREFPVPWLP